MIPDIIPDGFYLVGESLKPAADFQQAIIEAVQKVTHIAPGDNNKQIIGVDLEQFGVINYPCRELGLCAGYTDAAFVTTTEMYPDSPKSTAETCVIAQVTAITAAFDYAIAHV